MSDNNVNNNPKSNKVVVAILILILLAIIGYAVVQNTDILNMISGQVRTSNQQNDVSMPLTTATMDTNINDFAGGSSTEMPYDLNSDDVADGTDDSWKQAYLDYIQIAKKEGFDSFNLVYIDDNDIPELFLCTSSEGRVCTFFNGQVVARGLDGSNGCMYIERSGLFKNSSGGMGYFNDMIYSIQNGKFVTLLSGNHSGGDYLVQENYSIDGVTVTEEEYYNTIDDYFDHNFSESINDGEVSYKKFLNQINIK